MLGNEGAWKGVCEGKGVWKGVWNIGLSSKNPPAPSGNGLIGRITQFFLAFAFFFRA